MKDAKKLKQQILDLTGEYYKVQFGQEQSFRTGDRISYAGRIFDQE